MPGRIFISYRREDEQGFALRLFERLVQAFGAPNVFFDKDSIPPGFDFVDYIEKQIAQSDVVLVVIGRNWLTSADAQGRRRLDNPDDFVAVEVGAALAQQKHVVPLVVHGASMPIAPELPDGLKPLARRNAFFAPNGGANAEFAKLVESLGATLKELGTRNVQPKPTAAPPVPLDVQAPAAEDFPSPGRSSKKTNRRPEAAAAGTMAFVAASFLLMLLGSGSVLSTLVSSLVVGGAVGAAYLLMRPAS